MRGRIGLVAVVVATTLSVAAGARSSAAQPSGPTVKLDRTGTAEGEQMVVTGAGWPASSTLIVELCGHGGLRGSVDCDVAHQRTAGAGPTGGFSVELTTGRPPSPCPCVVRVTDQETKAAATASIAVAGVPTVPLTAADVPLERAIEITSIRVTGGGRWAELFGAGGRRVLEVTLENTGPLAIEAPDVTVAWGTGGRPDGFVTPPHTSRMGPGDVQTLTVPLHHGPLTIGKLTAVVEIQGLHASVTARASTTSYPWGLLAVALVVLQLLLLWIRNRVRRRLHRSNTDLPAPPGDAGADAAVLLDLDEPVEVVVPEHPSGAVLNGVALVHRNGTGHAVEQDEPVADIDAARAELVALQLRARMVLNQAVDLAEAIVADAAARAERVRAEAAEHLEGARTRHTESLQLLEEAKTRVDEVMGAATEAAAGALLDANAHRAAAHQALVEMQQQRQQLAATAAVAVDQIMRDLDAQMGQLGSPPAVRGDGDLRDRLALLLSVDAGLGRTTRSHTS